MNSAEFRQVRAILMLAVVGLAFLLGTVVIKIPADSNPNSLLPCPTEDSTHCYWDASEQGNGVGNDFVSP